jgi:putative membrane protein
MSAARTLTRLFLVSSLAACGGGEAAQGEVKSPGVTTSAAIDTSPTATPTTSVGTTAPPSNDTVAPPPAQPAAAQMLSDAQIAQIASSINQGEIDQANYAVAHLKSPQAVQLAKHMQTDHTAIGRSMTTLLSTQGIAPVPSALSTDLQIDADKTLATLKGESGRDLDKDYVDDQVKEHQDALDVLDNRLLPAAQNAQLKAALTDVRAKVAAHLAMAKRVQAAVSGVAR